jgi:hypothetical protein
MNEKKSPLSTSVQFIWSQRGTIKEIAVLLGAVLYFVISIRITPFVERIKAIEDTQAEFYEQYVTDKDSLANDLSKSNTRFTDHTKDNDDNFKEISTQLTQIISRLSRIEGKLE